MTHEQIDVLIQVINSATATMGWIAGLSITIFVATVGGTLALVFRLFSAKIEDARREAVLSREMATNVQESIGTMTVHCGEMRGTCREQLLTSYVDRAEIKEMDAEYKELVRSVLERLETGIRENRDLVLSKLNELKKNHEAFEDRATKSIQGHEHTEDGKGVIMK